MVAGMDFEKLLDSRPQSGLQILETEPNGPQLSAEEFELLERDISNLRNKILEGHNCTVAEMRQIVLFFRARRGKLFTVAKAKKSSTAAEKVAKTPVRRKTTTSKLKDMDAKTLLETLGL